MIYIGLILAVCVAFYLGKAKQRAEFKKIGLKREIRDIWRRQHGQEKK